MRMNYLALLILATAPLVGYAASRTFDFGGDTVGQPPKGFVFGHTAKVGAPGTWVVQAEGTNQYLAQTNADATRSRFPVAVVERRLRRGCRCLGALQAGLGSRRSSRRAGLALPERRQLLPGARQRARGQRRAVQGRARPAHRPAGEGRGPHLREARQRCRPANGAPCASSRPDPGSRYASTARSCTRSKTPRSQPRDGSASGPRPIR